jgi:hypothetical protein
MINTQTRLTLTPFFLTGLVVFSGCRSPGQPSDPLTARTVPSAAHLQSILSELNGCRVVIPPSQQSTAFVAVGLEPGATGQPANVLIQIGFASSTKLDFDNGGILDDAFKLVSRATGRPHEVRLEPRQAGGHWWIDAKWTDSGGAVHSLPMTFTGDPGQWDASDNVTLTAGPAYRVGLRDVLLVLLECDGVDLAFFLVGVP